VTRLEHVPDDVYDAARKQFSEEELLALRLAIVAINGWNRITIAFQTIAGDYQPGSPAGIAKEVSHA
jgi:alkylhydroperoxidase family enzyme